MAELIAPNQIKGVTYHVNPHSPYKGEQATRYGQAMADLLKAKKVENPAIDELMPEWLVDEAKKKSSPLHDAFEWDVQKAAEKHWLATARKLLGHIQVSIVYIDKQDKERTIRVKSYVNMQVTSGPNKGKRAYVPVTSVLASEAMRNAAYEQFQAAAHRFMATAASFIDDDTIEMVDDLRKILARMNGKFRRKT